MVSQLHVGWIEIDMEGRITIYVREEQNTSFLMIMKDYLLKLIFKSASRYFVDYITHVLNLVNNTFLMT